MKRALGHILKAQSFYLIICSIFYTVNQFKGLSTLWLHLSSKICRKASLEWVRRHCWKTLGDIIDKAVEALLEGPKNYHNNRSYSEIRIVSYAKLNLAWPVPANANLINMCQLLLTRQSLVLIPPWYPVTAVTSRRKLQVPATGTGPNRRPSDEMPIRYYCTTPEACSETFWTPDMESWTSISCLSANPRWGVSCSSQSSLSCLALQSIKAVMVADIHRKGVQHA